MLEFICEIDNGRPHIGLTLAKQAKYGEDFIMVPDGSDTLTKLREGAIA
jgi:hypothetical protein